MKKTVILHCVCAVLTAAFIAVSVFVFSSAYFRLWEGCRDFGLSVAFYFCRLFGINTGIVPTVNQYPGVPPWGQGSHDVSVIIPDNWADFASKMSAYGRLVVSGENFINYLSAVGDLFAGVCKSLLFIIPFFILIKILFSRYLKRENNDYNRDSIFLRAFKRMSRILYWPAKRFLSDFGAFVRAHKPYWIAWVCIWLLNFNAATVVLEALAYYLYFTVSFDFINIYRQVYKLFLDLGTIFWFVPWWCWPIIIFIVWNHLAYKTAIRRLNRNERMNQRLISNLSIAFLLVGKMGKKKTTIITDMALSQDVLFRDKALELLLQNDLKFPYFPWINLELELRKAMELHEVYNLASCRRFIRDKADSWESERSRENLFDYDYERYGTTFNNKLEVKTIWDVIETYAQLYFIFVIQSSLLVSNYSIREDSVLADLGNFPLWHVDFFESDPQLMDAFSRFSHIVDFDMLRLGRKIIQDNKNAGAFEFGCVVLTEAGKERGNMIDMQGMKRDSPETNQKNDLFNLWIKMIRHSGTVDNYPFVRVVMDEQRPESLGADARELCEIIHIEECSEVRLARPYLLGEIIHDWVLDKFQGLYLQFRHLRGDNTLLIHILKTIAAKTHAHYERVYNQFGFYDMGLAIEDGTQDGKLEPVTYKLSFKKTYARRFSTDCFSDFFAERAESSAIGLDDLQTYSCVRASFDELLSQKSYFINDLFNPNWRTDLWPSADALKAAAEAEQKDKASVLIQALQANPAASEKLAEAVKQYEAQKKIADKITADPALREYVQEKIKGVETHGDKRQ